MINSIQERLLKAGFSLYEAKAYNTLLTHGMLTASEISKISEIPQGRIYSVLKKLEERGFCTLFPGAVKKYEATNPNTAFNDLISERERAVEEVQDLQSDLEKLFVKNKAKNHPQDFIQILTSKQSQVNKFDELIKRSKKTLYSFNKKPYATGFMRNMEQIHLDSAPLRAIMERGTSVRAIFEAETEHVIPFSQMLKYYSSIGEEVRICEKLPLKMLLSDGELAMVSMRNNDTDRFKLISMVVEHSDLTIALTDLFEKYWTESMELDAYLKKYQSIGKDI